MSTRSEPPKLLTPAEVAMILRVDPKTVTRWARAGRLSTVRTAGGHRRYFQHEIDTMLTPEKLPYRPYTDGRKQ